jgi:hypothetical protein
VVGVRFGSSAERGRVGGASKRDHLALVVLEENCNSN